MRPLIYNERNSKIIVIDYKVEWLVPKKSDNRKKENMSAKTLVKLGLLLFVCIYVTCIFVKQQRSLSQCADLSEEYEQKIAEAKLEQQKLEGELEKAGSDEYIERTAREKLGLVKANERVFIDITQE